MLSGIPSFLAYLVDVMMQLAARLILLNAFIKSGSTLHQDIDSVVGSRREKVYKESKSFDSYLSQYQWSPPLRQAVHSSKNRDYAQRFWQIQRTTGLTQYCFALSIGRDGPYTRSRIEDRHGQGGLLSGGYQYL